MMKRNRRKKNKIRHLSHLRLQKTPSYKKTRPIHSLDLPSLNLERLGYIFGDTESEDNESDRNTDDNQNNSRWKEPVLAKYVRRNHDPNNIIGYKFDGVSTQRKIKGTCLLSSIEPKTVKEVVDDGD